MYQCTNVPIISAHDWYIGRLYQSWAKIIGTLVHWYIGSWVVLCTNHGPKSLVHWYIGTLGHGCTNHGPKSLVHWYIGSWVVLCTNHGPRSLVHWYIGSLVHWFVAALALSVNPKPSVCVCRVYVLYEKVELPPASCRYIVVHIGPRKTRTNTLVLLSPKPCLPPAQATRRQRLRRFFFFGWGTVFINRVGVYKQVLYLLFLLYTGTLNILEYISICIFPLSAPRLHLKGICQTTECTQFCRQGRCV